jgi:hypothetical protein
VIALVLAVVHMFIIGPLHLIFDLNSLLSMVLVRARAYKLISFCVIPFVATKKADVCACEVCISQLSSGHRDQ